MHFWRLTSRYIEVCTTRLEQFTVRYLYSIVHIYVWKLSFICKKKKEFNKTMYIPIEIAT